MLSHNVFFLLKDRSPEARARLVQACRDLLTGHPGTVSFACGVLAEEFNRPVNVRDWDVALHLVFNDKSAHDAYQEHPRHHQFVQEQSPGWVKAMVFDSYVEPA